MKLEGIAPNPLAGSRETPSTTLRRGALVLALLISVLAGVTALLQPSPYPYLLVFGIAAAVVFLAACLRYPVFALYAALAAALLPVGLLPETAHSYLNRALALTAAVMWALEAIHHKPRFMWPAATSFLLAFMLWASTTLFWARDAQAGVTIILTYSLRLILFLIVLPNQIRTRRALDGLLKALAFCGWAIVPAAFAAVLLSGYAPGTRLALLRVNANELGLVLIVLMIGVLWQTLKPTRNPGILNTVLAALFLLATIAIVGMTGSRGSAISLLLALAGFWLLKPTRQWGKLGLSIILIAVLLFPIVYATTLVRFTGDYGDTPLGGREVLWQEAWGLILEHPLLGVGIGNSSHEMIGRVGFWQEDLVPIHNPILVILSETGIVGLALYLGILLSSIVRFSRSWHIYQASGVTWLKPYFCLVASVMFGYLGSWIKGGGAETGHTYFLMLALLLIPSGLDPQESGMPANNQFASRIPAGVHLPQPRAS